MMPGTTGIGGFARLTRTALLVAALALPASGCGPAGPDSSDTAPRILVVGMDGMDWRVVLPLVQAGEMPGLEGLMRAGVFGKIETIVPTHSPIIWTTIATGNSPGKHGITGKTVNDDGGNRVRAFTRRDRKTKAVWNIFSNAGRKVHSVGWWMTYPAEEISGVMVAHLNHLFRFDETGRGEFTGDPHVSTQELAYPPTFGETVVSITREEDEKLAARESAIFSPVPREHSRLGDRLWGKIHWITTLDASHRKIASRLMDSGDPFDLMLVYFRGADVLAHNFWRFTYPERFDVAPTSDEVENYGGLVFDYYRHLDSVLSGLIREAGDGTTIVVLSDHGMEERNTDSTFDIAGEPGRMLSGGHRQAPPGIFVASGPGIVGGRGPALDLEQITYEAMESLGKVQDVTPTLLALGSLPVGEDMDGSVMTGILDPAFLEEHPILSVPTYETDGEIEEPIVVDEAGEEDEERLEELRSLGYIE